MSSSAFINHCSVRNRILHWIMHTDTQMLSVRWFYFIYAATSSEVGLSGSNADWTYPFLSAVYICIRKGWAEDPCSECTCALFPLCRIMARSNHCWKFSTVYFGARKSVPLFALRPPKEKKTKITQQHKPKVLLKRSIKSQKIEFIKVK